LSQSSRRDREFPDPVGVESVGVEPAGATRLGKV